MTQQKMMHATEATNLADILERVLEKGIVIAGDIKIQIADIDLLNIKLRLLVASVDRAMEMGINWWQQDSYLSCPAASPSPAELDDTPAQRQDMAALQAENRALRQRLERAEELRRRATRGEPASAE